MVTDLAEIHRLAIAKQAENLDFRRRLAVHHRPAEPFQILAAEIQKHVDCTKCANCCRAGVVAVSQADIEAMARHLEVPAEEAVHRYTTAAGDDSGARVLRSTRDGCVFLRGNRCTIYAARPKVCRDFPHVTLGTHSLGGRFSSLCRWTALCPSSTTRWRHTST